MSRESRLAKRDVKLKKLAVKRGMTRLPPQTTRAGHVEERRIHALFQKRCKQQDAYNAAEMQRALTKVPQPEWVGTAQERRLLHDQYIKDLVAEAKWLDFEGKRMAVNWLELAEHLARGENIKHVPQTP